jgi:hypothetical protein
MPRIPKTNISNVAEGGIIGTSPDTYKPNELLEPKCTLVKLDIVSLRNENPSDNKLSSPLSEDRPLINIADESVTDIPLGDSPDA